MKRFKIIAVATAFLLALYAPMSLALSGMKTGPVDFVQMESATRVGYESIMWILVPGTWEGSPNCVATWGYFNAKLSPHFAATALSARLTGKPLRVFVDDTYPKVDGFCQIINLQI